MCLRHVAVAFRDARGRLCRNTPDASDVPAGAGSCWRVLVGGSHHHFDRSVCIPAVGMLNRGTDTNVTVSSGGGATHVMTVRPWSR